MLKPIRSDALEQIRERRGPASWHADSMTGITASTSVDAMDEDTLYVPDDARSIATIGSGWSICPLVGEIVLNSGFTEELFNSSRSNSPQSLPICQMG